MSSSPSATLAVITAILGPPWPASARSLDLALTQEYRGSRPRPLRRTGRVKRMNAGHFNKAFTVASPFLFIVACAISPAERVPAAQPPLAPLAQAPLAEPPVARVPKSPRVLMDAVLQYVVSADGVERTLSQPMVKVKSGETETLFIVDTGSTHTVLTRSFVAAVGQSLINAEEGTDHAGAAVKTMTTASLRVTLGTAAFDLDAPLVIEGPPPFAAWGIGGFLSPQQLHPTAILIVDLQQHRLQLVEGRFEEVVSWAETQHPDLRKAGVPRMTGGENTSRLVVVEAVLDRSLPLRLMLNSGGKHAEFSPAFAGPVDGPEIVSGRGVSGKAVRGIHAPARVLVLGDYRLFLPEIVVRDQGEDWDGQLGSVVLAGSVLVISPDHAQPVTWLLRESKE